VDLIRPAASPLEAASRLISGKLSAVGPKQTFEYFRDILKSWIGKLTRAIAMQFLSRVLVGLSLVIAGMSYVQAQDDLAQAEVMMIGTFHFSNPGKDMVKSKNLDVMDAKSQDYLDAFAGRVAAEFRPTVVLLEYDREYDALIQERYVSYQDGTYSLAANEIYQMGFRIAAAAGNVPIASFDEREIEWDAERLLETMPTTAPEIAAAMDKIYAELSVQSTVDHATKSLQQLLAQANEPEADRANRDLYLMTNSVSTDGEYEGALAASSWWHRNFRMYAKIQAHAKPGSRILVIAGQGHTAILKDFLATDSRIRGVDVRPLF